MGALKIRQRLIATNLNLPGGDSNMPMVSSPPRVITPATGALISHQGVPVSRARISMTAVSIAVVATNDYGGTKVCVFPTAGLVLVGARLVGTLAADANLATALAAGTIDIGVGTATASATTLATTMIDYVPKFDVPASGIIASVGVTTQAASADDIYLNVAAATSVDGAVTFTGYLDIFYLDMGA